MNVAGRASSGRVECGLGPRRGVTTGRYRFWTKVFPRGISFGTNRSFLYNSDPEHADPERRFFLPTRDEPLEPGAIMPSPPLKAVTRTVLAAAALLVIPLVPGRRPLRGERI